MKNTAWSGKESDSIIRIGFNIEDLTVSMETVSGPAPDADRLLQLIITDRHFRSMSEKYKSKGRKYFYKIYRHEGMSGCRTYCIQTLKEFCRTIVPQNKQKEIFHESCFGKIHNFSNIYVGDLVEIIFHEKSYLVWKSVSERNWLYKRARKGVKYIPPIKFKRGEFHQKWDVHSF